MRFAEIVREGGNVFAGRTAAIAREHIEPTLERYFAELGRVFPNKASIMSLEHFVPLGSVGKKSMSGDIDLGISAQDLLDKEMTPASIAEWGIDPAQVDAQQEKLGKRARTATPEQLRMKAFLQMLGAQINKLSPNIYTDEKKIGAGNLFCLFPQYNQSGEKLDTGVQIDWMVGDLGWLTFSYYSSAYPEDSNVKGLHRTQLMLSAFQVADLSFDHVKGVRDKNTGDTVATNPEQAISILNDRLGTSIDRDTTENYYELHNALQGQLTAEQYDQLTDIYFRILDRTRTDIPDDMQDLWKQKQQKLGLTGKFLPDDSALAPLKLTESGVAGAPRVTSRQDFEKFLQDYESLISEFPGYQSMQATGSYHSDPNKEDFGDIDLVVHIESDADKAQVKRDLAQFLQAQPETIIVPFSSEKHAGKRTYNAGELVSVRFHSDTIGDSAQIDNIIALSPSEASYKAGFLNYAAPKQGLILGLVKVAAQETDPAQLFDRLGIDIDSDLPEGQEWEFNISPVELQLRRVTYEPGTTKQAHRDIVWHSRDMDDLQTLLYQYDLDQGFEDLVVQAQNVIKNPRSGSRISGLFRSMITVKSGEVGTPKAHQKIAATRLIDQVFGA